MNDTVFIVSVLVLALKRQHRRILGENAKYYQYHFKYISISIKIIKNMYFSDAFTVKHP